MNMTDRQTFEEVEPNHSLRPYQKDAVSALWRELKAHGKALLHSPTGSGKTRMAMALVSIHMREQGPTMVLWLAPTGELIDQAAVAFKEAWRHHGDIRAAVIQWWGEGEAFAHGMQLERNTMLVTGLQMAVREINNNPKALKMLRDKASLIVFDEAHQSVAPTYRELVEQIAEGKSALLLGLSATPGRARPDETKELAAMYGGRKVGVGPADRNPINFLVEKRYLADAHFRLLNFSGAPPVVGDGDEYPEEALKALGEMDDRNHVMVQAVIDLFCAGHRRVIVFTPSVESAECCAKYMRRADFPYAHSVHGHLPRAERNHILDTYRMDAGNAPHPQVIFNCKVLTAGVDLPQTSAVVIGKPTKSVVLLQQMIGRALRGTKSGGTDEAEILLIVDDSFEEFANMCGMFSKWDMLWEPV